MVHLGLIGYGNIAQSLIALLPVDQVPHVTVLVRSIPSKATPTDGPKITFVTSLDALVSAKVDVVAECAGHTAVATYASDILRAGIPLIIASLGAFSDADLYEHVLAAAQLGNTRLILPTGAIGGLDLLSVLSASGPVDVTYRGIKPPKAWRGSPAEALIDLDTLTTRTAFFNGTGRQAAADFPKNANVVAALALAGGGFDKMRVKLIADPDVTANIHGYDVVSSLCTYHMQIENAASPGNARTSMTTVLSILKEVLAYANERQQTDQTSHR